MSRKRILIIDDEGSFTRIVKLHLECRGHYAVLEVNRPQEAVRIALTFQPDLILVNSILSGMDNDELVRRLRAEAMLWRVPLLLLTAAVAPPAAGPSGQRNGGFVFLAKPVALTDLLHAIARQLEGPAAEGWPPPSEAGAPQFETA